MGLNIGQTFMLCRYCGGIPPNHANGCPEAPYRVTYPSGASEKPPVGWRCPVCNIGVAPWQNTCPACQSRSMVVDILDTTDKNVTWTYP